MTGVLVSEGDLDTDNTWIRQCDNDRGRDWMDVAASQGMLRVSMDTESGERYGTDSTPKPLGNVAFLSPRSCTWPPER
jgi:hypothetical protein